jgi:DNA-directed RNA polymerase I subunit RPA2
MPIEMKLPDTTRAHKEAFNVIFENHIIENIVANTPPLVMGNIKVTYDEMEIRQPFLSDKEHFSTDRRLLPRECRERSLTYRGRIVLKMSLYCDDKLVTAEDKPAGYFPIMVGSSLCHLPRCEDMGEVGEDEDEIGGYFIINGVDRVLRFQVALKRNTIFAINRQRRDNMFMKHMVTIRCVGSDEIGHVNNIHYSSSGNLVLKIFHNKREFFIPLLLVLRALANTTDEELFAALGGGQRAVNLLGHLAEYTVFSRNECLGYIGSKFKVVLDMEDNIEAGKEILRRHVAPHLASDLAKFNFLVLAARKLLAFAANEIVEDDIDLPSNQELFTETQVLANLMRDRLDDMMRGFCAACRKRAVGKRRAREEKENGPRAVPTLAEVKELFKKTDFRIGPKLEYFFSTGNYSSSAGSDLTSASGLVVVADRTNFYRYLSHFRSISRGSSFLALKITRIRKLRPESWGFICPVHTPDGTPCGILTHLASCAEIVSCPDDFDCDILPDFGVVPPIRGLALQTPVLVDGRVAGSTSSPAVLAEELRRHRGLNGLKMEVVYDPSPRSFQAVLIYTSIGRFTRKVFSKKLGKEEWIGIMEQVFLDIDLEDHERHIMVEHTSGSYAELDNTSILSILAGLTPYSDYNQSPRNMYQCQMAKQAMGVPAHNLCTRTDAKMYQLNYTQAPVVRTKQHDLLKDYPVGINCIVAVLSYTAYDMEDALVINKSSMERGLFTGFVYKTHKVELKRGCHFTYLPDAGSRIRAGDPLYSYVNEDFKEAAISYQGLDSGIVDSVRVFSNDVKCATFTFRIARSPSIGDKFCSRHGQKGVCSMHWPMVDMPFTESGVVPDIIINPHAFPSRMTIGMLLESMAGKSGCLLGRFQDGTPFKKSSSSESVGEELRRCGFNYYGNEPMYSGVSGNELRVDVFIGVVYYQRLRHMVSDKFQVRTGGAVVATTRQPIGGRKNQGGVRFGEMERDALIAHGTSHALRDRLMKCSDSTYFGYCTLCKSILFTDKIRCSCGNPEYKTIEMPYVFKYLCSELLAMNIRVKLEVCK